MGTVPSFVMRGLDPRIHLLAKMMDCRVKPGNDRGQAVITSLTAISPPVTTSP
jgi:hypothetical protein